MVSFWQGAVRLIGPNCWMADSEIVEKAGTRRATSSEMCQRVALEPHGRKYQYTGEQRGVPLRTGHGTSLGIRDREDRIVRSSPGSVRSFQDLSLHLWSQHVMGVGNPVSQVTDRHTFSKCITILERQPHITHFDVDHHLHSLEPSHVQYLRPPFPPAHLFPPPHPDRPPTQLLSLQHVVVSLLRQIS